ncbi:MAG: hypothetical protein ABUL44_01125 [Flavobacterium sp.]
MRKLILPLVVLFLFGKNNNVNAQSITSCANATVIDTTTQVCPAAVSLGNAVPATSNAAMGNSINGCGYPTNQRVTWYKFTPKAGQCVNVNVNIPGVNTEIALYTGCPTTVQGINSTAPRVNNTTVCFTDGRGVWSQGPNYTLLQQVYYLRVYTNHAYDATDRNYSLCAKATVSSPIDKCDAAGVFNYSALNTDNACAHYTPGEGFPNNNNDANPGPALICATALQNTVWYKFKVTTGGTAATVGMTNINCDSYNNSSQLLQAGLLRGTCITTIGMGGFTRAKTGTITGPPYPVGSTSLAGANTSCGATGNTTLYLTTDATVNTGEIIYLAIDGYSGANCRFSLQASQNVTPIPINLKNFTAWAYPEKNLIRWTTSWEHENSYFEVERSLDGLNYSVLKRVEGKANSNVDIVYDVDDYSPPSIGYYRLKQVDLDGKFTYSPVAQVK